MKKSWKMILLVLCLVCLPAAASALSEGNFEYTLSGGTASVTRYVGSSSAVVIPDTLGGAPVTNISMSTFFGNTSITSVTLPGGLTVLNTKQFQNCTNLTEVIFTGENITKIPESAFAYCVNLKSIAIPDGVTTISYYAFQGCSSLEDVTFPSSLTYIGDMAFQNTASLGSVTIPTSTQLTLRCRAFEASGLTSFTCSPETLSTDWDIFADCPRLKTVSMEAANVTMGTGLFRNCTALTSAKLPSALTALPESTFSGCTSLPYFSFPDAMTVIGSYAFQGCTALDFGTFYWPSQLITIESYAFQGCTSLACFALPHRSSLKTVGDYAFESCTALTDVQFFGDSSITSIGEAAFMDCTALQSICLGYNSINSIGNSAFYGCSSLIEINTTALGGTSLTSIGSACFGESGLMRVSLPSSVTSIKTATFRKCTSLEYVQLASGTTSIGNYAFDGCTSLCDFYMPDSVKEIGNYAFQNCTALCSAITTNSFGKIKLPSSLTSLGEGAFMNANCGGLTVPSGVTMIYANTFSGVTPPDSYFNLHDNILSIGDNVFSSAARVVATPGTKTSAALKRINQVYIGDYTRSGNTDMYQYYLGNTLTRCIWSSPNLPSCSTTIYDVTDAIGPDAFVGNTNLDNIHFGPNIASADASAFSDCTAFLHVPASSTTAITLAKLGLITYDNYFGLQYTLDGDNITAVTAVGFCLLYPDMTIPDTVTALDTGIFANTSSLKTLTIPDSVTTITDASISSHVLIRSSATAYARTWAKEHGLAWEHDRHTTAVLEAVEPTCDKDGWTEGSWCPECETIFTAQSLRPALGHTAVIDAPVEPTCTEDGLTEGSHCETCGETLVAQEILAAPGHTEGIVEGFPATCTKPGLKDFIFCEVCDEILQNYEEIPAPGHSPYVSLPAKDPTCTETGNTAEIHCLTCGELQTAAEEQPALGHTYGEPEFIWAEDEKACTVTFSCIRGDSAPSISAEITGEITLEATCTEMGQTTYTASVTLENVLYQDQRTVTDVPSNGHTPVTDNRKEPTNRQPGLTEGSHCDVCGETLVAQTEIPALFTYDGDTIIAYNGEATAVVLPEDATALSSELFKDNTSILSVTVPANITTVGSKTFYCATALTDIYLPDDLTGITATTFYKVDARIHAGADSATALLLSRNGKSFVTDDGLALRYRATSTTESPTEVWLTGYHGTETILELPDEVNGAALTQIKSGAFANHTQLTRLTVPDSVTSIDDDAFTGCSALTLIVTKDSTAHTWCVNHSFPYLIPVTIAPFAADRIQADVPDGLAAEVTITDGSFHAAIDDDATDWDALYTADNTRALLGAILSNPEGAAYSKCIGGNVWQTDDEILTALRNHDITDDLSSHGHGMWLEAALFDKDTGKVTLCEITEEMPYITAILWLDADGNELFAEKLVYQFRHSNPESEYTASRNDLLTATLPAYLKDIETEAFANSGMQRVILPEGCTGIGSRAFADCADLQEVYLPNSITSIADDAFSNTQVKIFCSTDQTYVQTWAEQHGFVCVVR